jgi:hypothetical protein
MKRFLLPVLLPTLLLLSVGCSDSNNSSRGNTPDPEVSLDETGIYTGTVETDDGDVALMSLLLARDGKTAITFQTDDSERATIILWGDSDGADGVITFEGTDTSTDESVTVDIQVDGDQATGRVDLNNLEGNYSLVISELSGRASSLANLAGEYARDDNLTVLSQLSVAGDGSASLSGECEATGSAREIDPAVNLYYFELESDCIKLEALVSLQDIEVENDVYFIAGDGGENGEAISLYRF